MMLKAVFVEQSPLLQASTSQLTAVLFCLAST